MGEEICQAPSHPPSPSSSPASCERARPLDLAASSWESGVVVPLLLQLRIEEERGAATTTTTITTMMTTQRRGNREGIPTSG